MPCFRYPQRHSHRIRTAKLNTLRTHRGDSYSFDEAAIVTDSNKKPEELATVLVFFNVTSHSVFPIQDIEFLILDLGDAEGRFLYTEGHVAPVCVGLGDTKMIRLYLDMNVKGLSDEEVAALVAKIKVEIQYEQTLFGGRHQRIKIPANLEFAEHRYF